MKAVLFDLDGVLVDAAAWHRQALDDALAEHGYTSMYPFYREELEGLPTRVKLDRLVTRGCVRREDVESIAALKQRKTRETMEAKLRFDPDKFCLLWGLKMRGYGVGVVTNCIRDTAMFVIDRLFADGNLVGRLPSDVLVTNEDGPPKPDTFPYDRAVDMLRLAPADCLAVEDNEKGVESATRAGCKVLRVASPAEVTPKAVWEALEAK